MRPEKPGLSSNRHNNRQECESSVGDSGLSRTIRDFAQLAAKTDTPVLLYGETGCGKNHLARHVHDLSARAHKPFVHVNCASIPASLFEREMFGHNRGAYTGAHESSPGFFEEANRGTLFLDELGELPLELQPKLLAVLDHGTIRRLGSTREISVRFRLLTATNRDLYAMVGSKQFRADLFYRCAVLEFRIPPLRKRCDELYDLTTQLLRRISLQEPPGVDDRVYEIFRNYSWPGNIRELDNALRHAAVQANGETIMPRHLPARLQCYATGPRWHEAGNDGATTRARYSAPANPGEEIALITEALRAENYNRTRAARRLGMARGTLWAKIHRYGIT